MPQYHIIEQPKAITDKDKGIFISCGIIMAKSVRSAWGAYKKLHKESAEKHPLNQTSRYHIYPINHSRFWDLKKGKWEINSFYGNHNQKKYQAKMRKRYQAIHRAKNKQASNPK
jgi:hypothetical protein